MNDDKDWTLRAAVLARVRLVYKLEDGNSVRAARALGISRPTLLKHLRACGIKPMGRDDRAFTGVSPETTGDLCRSPSRASARPTTIS
jgi:hypothetical protein